MKEDMLVEENHKLGSELHKLNAKFSICLQAFEALMQHDYTGIVEQTLAEIEKLDE